MCLVRERPRPRFDALPQWIKIGDRVEARLQGDWVEGTLEGEEPYAVQFDDGTIHNFEACDLRPVSTYDHGEADPDLDPAFDGAGKNWCDWRTMSPLAIDCAPASYRVVVQDPQGEFRQVSHYEPVEFDVDELVKYKVQLENTRMIPWRANCWGRKRGGRRRSHGAGFLPRLRT